MSHSFFIRRTVAVGMLGSAIVSLSATSAQAKENKRAICTAAITAYKDAVEESKAGHLREARTSLASCIEAKACAGLVPKCRAFSDKLAAQMSSIVPVVTDRNGVPVLDVEVKVDGQVVASHIDGMAVLVEAGPHDVTFSNGQGVITTQKILVLEGQRDRAVAITIGGATAPTTVVSVPAPEPRPVADEAKPSPDNADKPVAPAAGADAVASSHTEVVTEGKWAMPKSPLPYVIGGVGLAGVVAGGLLTFWGNKDTSDLQSTCSPNCQQSSVDHIKGLYVVADISFGVGAAALAVSTFLFATSHSTESAEKPVPRESLRLDVQPTRSGAFASVSGAF